jgi:hypothetical protein
MTCHSLTKKYGVQSQAISLRFVAEQVASGTGFLQVFLCSPLSISTLITDTIYVSILQRR